MAFGGDVDTLTLTFERLGYIFSGYEKIRDHMIEQIHDHRKGSMGDDEFFQAVVEGTERFSALEFLLIRAMFEIKKSRDKSSGIIQHGHGEEVHSRVTKRHSVSSFTSQGFLTQPVRDGHGSTGTQNCSRCGLNVKKPSKFCTNCGNKL